MKLPLQPFVLAALTSLVFTAESPAQTTAFTYQGQLTDGGQPANGIFDLQFTIYDSETAGQLVSKPITNSPVAVSNGLFTSTLDFGDEVFTGDPRWLEIAVRTNGVGAQFIPLEPRQAVTPTPYAIHAGKAQALESALSSGQLTGTYTAPVTISNTANVFAGDGSRLANVDAVTIGGLSGSNFWQLGGNAGATPGTHFLGTVDNQPLEIKVNGLRALRLEDNGDSSYDADTEPDGAPNVIGGSPLNFAAVGVVGAVIGGGGATNFNGHSYTNSVRADFGVVGGGANNHIADGSLSATIAGGAGNDIATNAGSSVIGGGGDNNIADEARYATIAGGQVNGIASESATIAGGHQNVIGVNAAHSTIGGGEFNNIADNSFWATLAGGRANEIGLYAGYSAVGGGAGNTIAPDGQYATIPGGQDNRAALYAFAAGRHAKANHTGSFVWADSSDFDFASTAHDQFLVRANGGVGINNNAPAAGLHIGTLVENFGPPSYYNEDIVVEADDAVLGLYSTPGGSWGSAVVLAQFDSTFGGTSDKWSMARTTKNSDTSLRFTYGTDSNYALNDTQMRIESGGNVRCDGAFIGGGADVAEAFDVEGDVAEYEPGDVLAISTDTDRHLVKCAEPYSTLVAGVHATQPGVVLTHGGIEADLSKNVPLGVVGVLPTKVCLEGGPIRRGDLLVSSSTPGHAMKADRSKLGFGMVLGKALEPFQGENKDRGCINVLVNVK